jgi:hypothetical protein
MEPEEQAELVDMFRPYARKLAYYRDTFKKIWEES